MAAHFLSYWKPSTARAERRGVGQPLRHSASAHYRRVVAGDTLWIVTRGESSGELVLLGRIVVGQRTADKQRVASILGTDDLWDAAHHVLAAPESVAPMCELALRHLASALRFESVQDRLSMVDGRVDARQLQAMRRLTPRSADLLQQFWEQNASPRRDESGGLSE